MLEGKEIQVDDGDYTRIHNAILEALAKARLSGAEFRCVFFLLRKTYGWQKKEDKISLSQWETGTDTKRSHLVAILNGLIEKNIIYRRLDEGQVPYFGFNKYLETWRDIGVDSDRGKRFDSEVLPDKVLLPEQVTVTIEGNSTVTIAGNETVTIAGTHKRKKETIKESLPEHQIMFGKLAEICKIDMKLMGSQIGKTSKSLLGAGYTCEDLEKFRVYWYAVDFRGLKGQAPTLQQVIANISISKNTNGAGHKKESIRDMNTLPLKGV
jgi:phage replication O-like protein O